MKPGVWKATALPSSQGGTAQSYEKYGVPILSHVIYLRPNVGRNDPDGYRQARDAGLPNHRGIQSDPSQ